MAHYYVKTGGNDSLDGLSDANAWATITKVNAATPGADGIVSFRGGDTFTGQISAKAGTSGHPVTYNSYGTGKATIHNTTGHGIYLANVGNVTVDNLIFTGPAATSAYDGISCYTTTASTYRSGITITNVEASGWRYGIQFGAGAATRGYNGVTVTNCDLHDNIEDGFKTYGAKSGTTYTNNNFTITNCRSYDNDGDTTVTARSTGYGFDLEFISGVTVEYCTAHGNGINSSKTNGGPSGFMAYQCNLAVFRHCLSYSNRAGPVGGDGDGFDFDIGTTNSLCEYCLAYDNDGAGLLAFNCGAAGNGNTYRYNLSYGNGKTSTYGDVHIDSTCIEVLVYNNTIVAKDNGSKYPECIRIMDGASDSGCKIYNNILVASAQGKLVLCWGQGGTTLTSAQVLFGGNLYYPIASGITWQNSTYTTLAAWRAAITGQEVVGGTNRGITADPLLANASSSPTTTDPNNVGATADSLKLQGGSPAYQTGIPYATLGIASPGTIDYWGETVTAATPSIGASAAAAVAAQDITGSLTVTATLSGAARFNTHQTVTGSLAVTATRSGTASIPGRPISGALTATATLSGAARLNTHQEISAAAAVTATATGEAGVHPARNFTGSLTVTATDSGAIQRGQNIGGALAVTATRTGGVETHIAGQTIGGTLTVTATRWGESRLWQQSVYTAENRTDLQLLNDQLLHGDPVSRAEAAHRLGDYKSQVDKEFLVTVYNKLWVPIGEAGDDMIELSGSDPRNNLGTATLKLKGNSNLIAVMEDCRTTMIGVTVQTAGLRFAYYVDTFDLTFENSEWVGIANLNSIWDVLNYLVIWPNFLLPIQAQIPSHAVFIGPLCTVIEVMVSEQALRIQTGLWEFVNNALSLNPDIRAWFGALLQSNANLLEMLKCPVYVVHHNPLFDTSPLVAKTVRMETCATVIRDITRAYGVDVRVDLWLPGDEQPDFWSQNFGILRLDQPTYVVRVDDRSQISGPTGTVLDSAIRTVVDVGGSFFGEVYPFIQQVPGMDGVFYSPLLGQEYAEPWAILIAPDPVAGDHGNIVSCKISHHTPKGWQHIIGGRSPKWLNDLLNATFAWIIDSISILIGLTGIPSSLLEGFLNDVFLAFQLIENYTRRNAVGPYHPAVEVFHATSSSPYNIETLFGFINAMWDSRGYTSAVVTIRNGETYTLGKDIFLGGLVSLLYHRRTRLYTDYVENVTFRVTEDVRDLMIQIGDGRAKESPLAKHQRFLTGVLETINVVTLAPSSAGLL